MNIAKTYKYETFEYEYLNIIPPHPPNSFPASVQTSSVSLKEMYINHCKPSTPIIHNNTTTSINICNHSFPENSNQKTCEILGSLYACLCGSVSLNLSVNSSTFGLKKPYMVETTHAKPVTCQTAQTRKACFISATVLCSNMATTWLRAGSMPFKKGCSSRFFWIKKRTCQNTETPSWLVVEPTHLKNMLVKMGSSSPRFGVKIKNI